MIFLRVQAEEKIEHQNKIKHVIEINIDKELSQKEIRQLP